MGNDCEQTHVAVWDYDEKPILVLITPEFYDTLPDGTILHGIAGTKAVKGKDHIDQDTRGGYIAWGFHVEHSRDPIGRNFEHSQV